jgi:hypothetical protein
MNRKKFLKLTAISTGAICSGSLTDFSGISFAKSAGGAFLPGTGDELSADLVIAGGGLGGCAAALSALRNGLKVVMTEETDWIGGQIVQQGVPPDEHQWIETHGSTQLYRDFRNSVRSYYVRNYPLTESAGSNRYLNPGDGSVSRLCHEPRAALAVLLDLLAPYISSKKLVLLVNYRIVTADVEGNRVRSLKAFNQIHEKTILLSAPFFIDATELGDLLPLTGTEFVTGTESQKETRELHAPEKDDPYNNQAFTYCFAVDYIPEEDHTIEKPVNYDFWVNYKPQMIPPWPGRLLDFSYSNPSTLKPRELGFNPLGFSDKSIFNLWNYRRIINKDNFRSGAFAGDITVVNWPQNDYLLGNLTGVDRAEFKKHIKNAKQLSLSLLYWLQTEAPRPDKGYGWPGLRLRCDIMGTEDGLAKYPYIRESRRIKALFTVLEEHVGKENRALITGKSTEIHAAEFYDSVGVGYYHIDLHPSSGGNNYIDFDSMPFQIPLGALIPVRMDNLIPANKNIGTTHITNGCYRLHPVEWNIGESAGLLAAFAINKKVSPRALRENRVLLAEFQNMIHSQGIETHWPEQ